VQVTGRGAGLAHPHLYKVDTFGADHHHPPAPEDVAGEQDPQPARHGGQVGPGRRPGHAGPCLDRRRLLHGREEGGVSGERAAGRRIQQRLGQLHRATAGLVRVAEAPGNQQAGGQDEEDDERGQPGRQVAAVPAAAYEEPAVRVGQRRHPVSVLCQRASQLIDHDASPEIAVGVRTCPWAGASRARRRTRPRDA
jgi:hypothetical protein